MLIPVCLDLQCCMADVWSWCSPAKSRLLTVQRKADIWLGAPTLTDRQKGTCHFPYQNSVADTLIVALGSFAVCTRDPEWKRNAQAFSLGSSVREWLIMA